MTWNEFLPISMPMTVIVLIIWDMAGSLSGCPWPAYRWPGREHGASRVFCGHQTQIAHQLARILKAGEITNLGQHPYSRNEINPSHRLQGRDHLGERPLGYYLADGIFQTVHPLTFLAYPLK